ncbi:MAG TPA: hypothetical protein VF147_10980, partial [Vicinamibacterales bacterium]
MFNKLIPLAVALLLLPSLAGAQEPTLQQVLERLGRYVASYGEKAALIVATEKYMQSVTTDEGMFIRPRSTMAEFAVVKTDTGPGWIGYRDVFEVDGNAIGDRRDRLVRLLTEGQGDAAEVTRIANESARYNIGPIARNFNVPTTTLLFFQPDNLARFKFTSKGKKNVDGIAAWQIDFTETQRPTLIMTRAGRDVPIEGSLWVVPADGTVIRTRLRMKGFSDDVRMPEMKGPAATTPAAPATPPPSSSTGRGQAPPAPLPQKMS